MSFAKGDTVRLATAHRGRDQRHVVRAYLPGSRFRVLAHVGGEPDVRVRDAAGVSTLLIPAAKLRRMRADPPRDGDGTGGGPVG